MKNILIVAIYDSYDEGLYVDAKQFKTFKAAQKEMVKWLIDIVNCNWYDMGDIVEEYYENLGEKEGEKVVHQEEDKLLEYSYNYARFKNKDEEYEAILEII